MNERSNELRDKLLELEELLEDSDVYDVATALRGPDLSDEVIKEYLTGRIRYFVLGENAADLAVIQNYEFTEYNAVAVINSVIGLVERGVFRDKYVLEGFLHYLQHIKLAVGSLNIAELMSDEEYSLMFKLVESIRDILEGYGISNEEEVISELYKLRKKYGEENE